MGYACPVCADPQADAEHLANHLAFTALVRGGDHEEWLDDHVPDWDAHDGESLGAVVAEYAEQEEYPQVFEDTTGGHDHDRSRGGDVPAEMLADAERELADEEFGADVADILDEAREMTARRRDDSETE